MPERRVLPANLLRITDAEMSALLEIRELFAAGNFHHDPDQACDRSDGFNMNVPLEETACGTTGCIGGWMWALMKRDRTAHFIRASYYVNVGRSQSLVPLFFPLYNEDNDPLEDATGHEFEFPYELMTPDMALKAIDNFLATGNPNWPQVCCLDAEIREPEPA